MRITSKQFVSLLFFKAPAERYLCNNESCVQNRAP